VQAPSTTQAAQLARNILRIDGPYRSETACQLNWHLI
jgi:hypothetical protein